MFKQIGNKKLSEWFLAPVQSHHKHMCLDHQSGHESPSTCRCASGTLIICLSHAGEKLIIPSFLCYCFVGETLQVIVDLFFVQNIWLFCFKL